MASNPDGQDLHANHDPQLLAVVIIFTIFAVAAAALRIISRRMKKLNLWIDDYLIFIALILSMTQSIHVAAGLRQYGIGRHIAGLNERQIKSFIKLYYEVGLIQPTVLTLAKISVLILYHRIFITRGFRVAVWIMASIVVMWWIGAFFASALLCLPVEKNWEPTVRGHCGDSKLLEITSPVPWIVTDLTVLLLPLPMIRDLHMPRKQKIGLSVLFLLGGFSLVSSCIRYSLVFYSNDDPSWNIVPTAIWTLIEAYVTVISACLIVIKPVFVKLFPENLLSSVQDKIAKRNGRSTWRFDSFARLNNESRPVCSAPSQDLAVGTGNSASNEGQKPLPLQDIIVRQDWQVSSTPREVV